MHNRVRLSVYDTALMLAGQFCLVHMHNKGIAAGSIVVIPAGDESGVYINPSDAPPCTPTLSLAPATPAKKRRR